MNYLILGANGGVGSCVSQGLRKAGHHVCLAGRNKEELAAMSSALESPLQIVDATDIGAVGECIRSAQSDMGSIDGVINCVGSILLKPAHTTSAEEWQGVIAQNLTSSFAVVKFAADVMKESGGSVVLFSSAAAHVGLPNHEAIAAAKAGVAGLTRAAAASYASRRIRVNAVAPGLVKSKMSEPIWSRERSAEFSRKMHASGRLGEASDIASFVLWLLQPENDWVTGSVFSIDGGLANVRPS